jgi:hypothetical protein
MNNTPTLTRVWTAEVDIGDKQDLGCGPMGHRYLVPVLGGRFDGPSLSGQVLAGGADRQWLRPDGIRELDALYEMRCEDGTVMTVRNRVVVDESRSVERYARSVVQVNVPDGPHSWLSRRVLVGTIYSMRPERQAVQITVYKFD